jgi:hypothetical protein
MAVFNFSQFSERRAAREQLAQDGRAALAAASGDRWAQLHAERPKCEMKEVPPHDASEADFWSDLQFRLAYPTHRLRTHGVES